MIINIATIFFFLKVLAEGFGFGAMEDTEATKSDDLQIYPSPPPLQKATLRRICRGFKYPVGSRIPLLSKQKRVNMFTL